MSGAAPEAGGLTPHEEIAPALALLPRGKHVFLKGVSHAWLHNQPERGRKAIADFLTAVGLPVAWAKQQVLICGVSLVRLGSGDLLAN